MSTSDLDESFARADVVFVGRLLKHYAWPPPTEPHGSTFSPVTYQVLRVFKGDPALNGGELEIGVLVSHEDELVDAAFRLRPTVFVDGRRFVVFAENDGPWRLARRPGVVAATRDVLDHLEGRVRSGR